MSALIDTHCHLDLLKNIQANTKEEDGLGIKTITVTNAPSFFIPNKNLFSEANNIRVALGLHPQLIQQYAPEMPLFEQLIKDVRFIGEIGLDGSPELQQTYQLQKKIFEQIVSQTAYHNGKILTVHSRHAAGETINILNKWFNNAANKVILHWYTGNKDDLQTAIRYGYYFSVNHKMLTAAKSKQLIEYIPLNRLLTETDAPFTFGYGINTRADSLNATVNGIASIRKLRPESVVETIYANFKTLLS